MDLDYLNLWLRAPFSRLTVGKKIPKALVFGDFLTFLHAPLPTPYDKARHY